MSDGTIGLPDGRTVGFAEFGAPDGTAVLWCHGGPGSRLEPRHLGAAAAAAGLRTIGIDRPGYGLSTPHPGRTIAGWVPEALAVADHLGVDRFVAVGESTGGAYALALAARAASRVLGAVPACSMTDMRYAPARATMSPRHALAVWDAPDRDAAIEAAIDSHGLDGSRIFSSGSVELPASDVALLNDPEWRDEMIAMGPAMFAHGLEGYADDRIADDGGWVSFDVGSVTCPVIVLHGGADVITTVVHAQHTASIIRSAELRVVPGLGHFSIEPEIIPAILDVLAR